MSDYLKPRDPRGRRGRITTPAPQPRRKAHHAVHGAVCFLHGGQQPRFSCQGCIDRFESDRDFDGMNEAMGENI